MANYDNGGGGGGRNRGDRETEQLRKLFIGGLTPNVTEDDLKQHFGQWGELVDVVVMKDKVTTRSRGFGFVTYKDENSVDEAQTNRPHVFDNKEVETKRAMPRGESANSESHVRVEKLFVGGLKPETTADELRDYFSSYGEVVTSEIATMRETGKPRGFGFVTFKDYDPVDKAILYKPHNIGSSLRVDCKKALSKEQMADVKSRQQAGSYNVRGGFGGGRGGGGYGGGGYGGGGGGYGNGGGYSGGYADGGYGSGGGYGGGYGDASAGYGSGGFSSGAEMGGYSEGGEGTYDNGSGGFGSYGSQGYSGGPSKPMGGFGGGPQRFQPYGGAPSSRGGRGRGGGGGGFGGGGFRGGRGGRGGY